MVKSSRNRKAGGDGAFWGVTPLGLLTSQCPRHRPCSKCLPVPWRDKASHSSPLMIYAPSCSAPCKAFSLNSLPFSRTAAAHICGNQAMATPPPRPARLPQTWLPRPKLPLPSKHSLSLKLGIFQPPSTSPAVSRALPITGTELRSFPQVSLS